MTNDSTAAPRILLAEDSEPAGGEPVEVDGQPAADPDAPPEDPDAVPIPRPLLIDVVL